MLGSLDFRGAGTGTWTRTGKPRLILSFTSAFLTQIKENQNVFQMRIITGFLANRLLSSYHEILSGIWERVTKLLPRNIPDIPTR